MNTSFHTKCSLLLGYAINPDADGTKGEEYVGDRIGAEEAKGETNITLATPECLHSCLEFTIMY